MNIKYTVSPVITKEEKYSYIRKYIKLKDKSKMIIASLIMLAILVGALFGGEFNPFSFSFKTVIYDIFFAVTLFALADSIFYKQVYLFCTKLSDKIYKRISIKTKSIKKQRLLFYEDYLINELSDCNAEECIAEKTQENKTVTTKKYHYFELVDIVNTENGRLWILRFLTMDFMFHTTDFTQGLPEDFKEFINLKYKNRTLEKAESNQS